MSKPLAQFSYDIWGDRVNIASRLQTHELPNAVHVSDPVFERLKARFEFEDTRKASRWRKRSHGPKARWKATCAREGPAPGSGNCGSAVSRSRQRQAKNGENAVWLG